MSDVKEHKSTEFIDDQTEWGNGYGSKRAGRKGVARSFR